MKLAVEDIRGRTDFVILTIRDDEFEAVLRHFPARQPVSGGRQIYEYDRVRTASGVERGVAILRALEQGHGEAQSVARDALEDLQPKWLILAGIAGGAPSLEFTLGDVLLANRLHDFSISAVLEERLPTFQQMGGPVHREVAKVLRALPAWTARLGDWSSETSIAVARPPLIPPNELDSGILYGAEEYRRLVRDALQYHFSRGSRPPLFRVGAVATSNVLVKDTALLTRWQESARHLTHVEMEAGGAYIAARAAAERETPFLSVRGISDIVGLRRSHEWTSYACHTAASFVRALVASELIELAPKPPVSARVVEPKQIATSRLPRCAQPLVGREDSIQELSTAWNDQTIHMLSIVAWGGSGKTSLVHEWVSRLARDNWPGVQVYYDWSFYAQGTRDHGGVSSDFFISDALRAFGDPEPDQGSAYDRGERLAKLVAARATLLVLDGVEPLQYGSGPMQGQLQDPALRALLLGLAIRPNPGLCIVTTREPITDLRPYQAKTTRVLELNALTAEAGAELLHSLGVRRAGAADVGPGDEELKEATRAVAGHALTLHLLGSYLARAHGGDIRRRDRVLLSRADAVVQGGHAFRVIEAYVQWLSAPSGDDIPRARQLAVLRLLSLFDRPADSACLAILLSPPAIDGLTEPLIGMNEEEWNLTISDLAQIRLIEVSVDDFGGRSIDTHPIVRAYFAERFRTEQPDAWREAHWRLCTYLTQVTDYRPDTLVGLQPLYQAVAHACRAQRRDRALEIYWDRIQRDIGPTGFYARRRLGAFGADLSALAEFFEVPWSRFLPGMSSDAEAWIQADAGYLLRAIGRLEEAERPYQAALNLAVSEKLWSYAATRASNLCELELALGRIGAALSYGQQAVSSAEKTGDRMNQSIRLARHADALHQAGRFVEASLLFEKAELVQKTDQPGVDILYGAQGFHYCDFLLRDIERDAWRSKLEFSVRQTHLAARKNIIARAERSLRWVSARRVALLDEVLDNLTLVRCHLYGFLLDPPDELDSRAARMAAIEGQMDATLDLARREGSVLHLPDVLIARAIQRSVNGDLGGCRDNLGEAWRIAERSSMKLYMADIRLTEARIFRDCTALDQAASLIKACGYHRRDVELADAEAFISGTPGTSPQTQAD